MVKRVDQKCGDCYYYIPEKEDEGVCWSGKINFRATRSDWTVVDAAVAHYNMFSPDETFIPTYIREWTETDTEGCFREK